MKEKFSHLNVHSDYSMVDSLCKPVNLIKKAYNLKMSYIALTDYNNLFGILKFYRSAHEYGIKPLLGLETKIIFTSISSKQEYFNIILLALNYTGYRNLLVLISKAYKFRRDNQFSTSVFITRKWLMEQRDGLLVISSSYNGDIIKFLLRKQFFLAKNYVLYYKKYFPESYYIEVSRIGEENEEMYFKLAIEFSFEQDIPLVATNRVRFFKEEDFYAHKVRLAINKGFNINDVRLKNLYTKKQFFRSEQEMCDLFRDIPEVLINSVEIAKRCNVLLPMKKKLLPLFSNSLKNESKILIKKSKIGLKERLNSIFSNQSFNFEISRKYQDRLNKELDIINKIGFPGYFLVVMEFIHWSKKNNIPVGPGRGSGAGSLVAYALKITELDPISLDLLFERFLNLERLSMPDFDIDFCMDRRDEVIHHVSEKYGVELVSQIITFGAMTAKSVVRDVGRVFGYPYGFVNNISKLIPLDPGMSIRKSIRMSKKLCELYKNNSDVRKMFSMAKKLEGLIRNIGKHAGGVIISPKKIVNFSPLYCDEFGKSLITQFDKDDLEYVGLVKFDFLGLKTLTIINTIVEMVNKKRIKLGQEIINIHSVSLEDQKVFKTLKGSYTIGIFQLESRGMKDLINRLKPDSFEDLIALIALFRPGPLQSGMVDNFIDRKHGKEEISYPIKNVEHELLRPILNSTYGIILYQEQVMKIAQVLSRYSLGSADVFRRVISKKKSLEMGEQRSIFINGAIKNNIDKHFAEKIFSLLEKFANYGFNKSHSAAYALISYQTLWLKTYYPAEFIAAAMTSEMDNIEKIVLLVYESKRMNIKIIPPHINNSKYYFYVNKDDCIVYGLGAIKGVGKIAIDSIIQARRKNGSFADFFDFCTKIDHRKVNKKTLEKLIMSGSLDIFSKCRLKLLRRLDYVFRSGAQYLLVQSLKKKSLFGSLFEELKGLSSNNFTKHGKNLYDKDVCIYEYETLGLYLTIHPVLRYRKEITRYVKNITFSIGIGCLNKRNKVFLFGVLTTIIFKTNSFGKSFVTFIIDNGHERISAIMFSKPLEMNKRYIKNNALVFLSGCLKFDSYLQDNQVIIDHCKSIEDLRIENISFIKLFIKEKKTSFLILERLHRVLKKYNYGTISVYIFYLKRNELVKINLGKKWNVFPKDELFQELKVVLGKDNVKLVCQ